MAANFIFLVHVSKADYKKLCEKPAQPLS